MQFVKAKIKYFLVVSVLFFSSCNSDDEPAPQAITNEEAADIIAGDLASDNGGFTLEIQKAAESAVTLSQESKPSKDAKDLACGVLTPYSYQFQKPEGTITYDYSMSLNVTLNCVNDIPSSAALTYSSSGEYNGLLLASNSSATANLDITAGLDLKTGIDLTFEGAYDRSSSYTFKRSTRTTNGTTEMDLDIEVDPVNYQINNGTASITLQGNTSEGGSYTIQAGIVFLGNNLAEVTINGKVFTVNLKTGEVTV